MSPQFPDAKWILLNLTMVVCEEIQVEYIRAKIGLIHIHPIVTMRDIAKFSINSLKRLQYFWLPCSS
jgi:hypothetical protein